jgi:predicted DNA-binding antitoxin AbrB/MazE fold protein
MTITIEAIYENGMLKPLQPLPTLKEHQRVEITIVAKPGTLAEAYGLLGWTGSAEDAEFLATDPDLEYPDPDQP